MRAFREPHDFMKHTAITLLSIMTAVFVSCSEKTEDMPEISGIYPHLAFYNNEAECGTGAVVPWNGKLWALTYAPHSPYGSSDKLYSISSDMTETCHRESIGGTPASRLIHRESGQLFIGPYAIDGNGNIRAMDYHTAPGRYTGAARHLQHPDSLIYIATMEEGFYEVNVNSLATRMLWSDDNVSRKPDGFPDLEKHLAGLPGWHGKGFRTGQGVMIYANNGEQTEEALGKFDAVSGSLCEYDGKSWKLIRRNQFTDVTGPGGIYGSDSSDTDPIWTIGFDHKSLILGVREHSSGWSFFRLPKGSHCYDGAHGWNTEWPRIRDIGTGSRSDYLMTMHGMFWKFPGTFSADNTSGIRPRSAYLKVVGDFARWNGRLVLGCDDSAEKEFLNVRKAKGGLIGPGQSNSNLWFMDPDTGPDSFGTAYAGGYVWKNEMTEAGRPSEPFLFAGWARRCLWLKNYGSTAAVYTLEKDMDGNAGWTVCGRIVLDPGQDTCVTFPADDPGEWIRIRPDVSTRTTAAFVYMPDEKRPAGNKNGIFDGLATCSDTEYDCGLLWSTGSDRRTLGIVAGNGKGYEVHADMHVTDSLDASVIGKIKEKCAIRYSDIFPEEASVLVIDDKGRRWRLPCGDGRYSEIIRDREARICREIATERDLFNCHGTFYELPAENADGFAKIRPVSSHDLLIYDYASYRGLLTMTGTRKDADHRDNSHIYNSPDGEMSFWAGAIDDLWQLGKPVGHGGPWYRTEVAAGEYSDPYLIGGYDSRIISIGHDSGHAVTVTAEMDPIGDGEWMTLEEFRIEPGEKAEYTVPELVNARWIRFRSDSDARITAMLEYR